MIGFDVKEYCVEHDTYLIKSENSEVFHVTVVISVTGEMKAGVPSM